MNIEFLFLSLYSFYHPIFFSLNKKRSSIFTNFRLAAGTHVVCGVAYEHDEDEDDDDDGETNSYRAGCATFYASQQSFTHFRLRESIVKVDGVQKESPLGGDFLAADVAVSDNDLHACFAVVRSGLCPFCLPGYAAYPSALLVCGDVATKTFHTIDDHTALQSSSDVPDEAQISVEFRYTSLAAADYYFQKKKIII